jgi:hypothetical protein
MGMTWKSRVQRGAFALMLVGALAMASGANWFDALYALFNSSLREQLVVTPRSRERRIAGGSSA